MTDAESLFHVLRRAAQDPDGVLAEGVAESLGEHLIGVLEPRMAALDVSPGCILAHAELDRSGSEAPSDALRTHVEACDPCLLYLHLPAGPPTNLREQLADAYREELEGFRERVARRSVTRGHSSE